MRAFVFTAALLLATLASHPTASAAEPPLPPPPTRWVTDSVGFLSPTMHARLDARLEAYQRATGHQVVVWIGDTIGSAALDDWAVRTFAAWKLGRKGFDDGIVMFILAQDRKIDIEVGYGLEGQVPDAIARRIIDDMAPPIRAGDHDGAVATAAEALLTAIEGHPFPGGDELGGTGQVRERPPATLGQKIFFGIVAIIFIILFITNPRLAMLLLWSVMGRGGGGGGGGGFSGGGGRSGGGGARGGW